ncbi:phospholipase effector Tle1 domain-containing protein, partial [Lonsdalea quercina]|uniref:phospholipase effector Tle1 domain-containing protein n=1 Tax=Lonsdalea quercina TaxID=71657 RepID=UPI003976A62D
MAFLAGRLQRELLLIGYLNYCLVPAKRGDKPELCLESAGVRIPLSIEFLGLLDTVASVGVANIAPFAEGHMGWADGAMELPDNGLIKKCTHLVSSHEQRLCFPLDSICRSDGTYPGYATEVVYPGMHSDIGGGYPPGDQGKATGNNDVRGVQIEVTLDSHGFAGRGDICLFGEMLSRFFA